MRGRGASAKEKLPEMQNRRPPVHNYKFILTASGDFIDCRNKRRVMIGAPLHFAASPRLTNNDNNGTKIS